MIFRLENGDRYDAIEVPNGVKRIVVCDDCKKVVGMDRGTVSDIRTLDFSIRGHAEGKKGRHNLEEVKTKNGEVRPYRRNSPLFEH